MQSHSTRLWLLAFALGWSFDLLFWRLEQPGFSFLLFVALTLGGGLALLWKSGILPARNTWFLLVPVAFFAGFTVIRLEPLTLFLGYSLTIVLLGLLAITYTSGRWPLYSLADYLLGFLRLAFSLMAGPLLLQAQTVRVEPGEDAAPKKASAFWPVVRGLLFALPIVAFFTALLTSADAVFAQRLQGLVELFRLEKLPEYIFRLIYIAALAYALVGVFVQAAKTGQDDKLLGLEKPLIPPFLGFTEAAVVLASVNILFASFVFIQFQYFFGGLENIQIDRYTYADYARNGFGELVTVAFFSLLLLLGLSAITRRAEGNQRQVFSALGIFLVLMVGVMLVSAFQRLILYEMAYGFTRLRTYTHVFIIWLGLLLAATIILELKNRQRAFALAAIAAALGFAVSLTVLNVDAFIARQNVERKLRGEVLDVGYLASLSHDAIPALAELYRSPRLDAATRDQVGAALVCFNGRALSRDQSSEPDDWRSFHFARFFADQAIARLDLSAYQLDADPYPSTVTTPSGKTYDCYEAWMD